MLALCLVGWLRSSCKWLRSSCKWSLDHLQDQLFWTLSYCDFLRLSFSLLILLVMYTRSKLEKMCLSVFPYISSQLILNSKPFLLITSLQAELELCRLSANFHLCFLWFASHIFNKCCICHLSMMPSGVKHTLSCVPSGLPLISVFS